MRAPASSGSFTAQPEPEQPGLRPLRDRRSRGGCAPWNKPRWSREHFNIDSRSLHENSDILFPERLVDGAVRHYERAPLPTGRHNARTSALDIWLVTRARCYIRPRYQQGCPARKLIRIRRIHLARCERLLREALQASRIGGRGAQSPHPTSRITASAPASRPWSGAPRDQSDQCRDARLLRIDVKATALSRALQLHLTLGRCAWRWRRRRAEAAAAAAADKPSCASCSGVTRSWDAHRKICRMTGPFIMPPPLFETSLRDRGPKYERTTRTKRARRLIATASEAKRAPLPRRPGSFKAIRSRC